MILRALVMRYEFLGRQGDQSMFGKEIREEFSRVIVGYGAQSLGALLLLAVSWIVAGWVSRMLGRGLERARVDLTLSRFVARLARWVILLLAILGCLGIFGVETTSFAAVIGAAGLAVGLAFQGTLANFAAGVMLLVFRPFEVNDAIKAAGQSGKVDAIGIFATTIDTFDRRRLIIPNSSIFGSTIENMSHHPSRRVEIQVGVSYDAEIDHCREVLQQAAESVPDRLEDPAPAVVVTGLAASSVDWTVYVWANAADLGKVKQGTIAAVKKSLEDAGIGIPYPQMEVHLPGREVA